MPQEDVIRLQVRGVLEHRDLVLRTVSAAVRLAEKYVDGQALRDMRNALVSAVGEAFNNIALHGYENRPPGPVEVVLAIHEGGVNVEMHDHGNSFDPRDAVSPDLDSMPESGLGVFIMTSLVDALEYNPGAPNVLKLEKRFRRD